MSEDGHDGICTMEGLDQEQLDKIFRNGIIDCRQCDFYKKFKDDQTFTYTAWGGEIQRRVRCKQCKRIHDGSHPFKCMKLNSLITREGIWGDEGKVVLWGK